MSTSGWINFWKDQKQSFDATMKINTEFFALRMEELFQLKPTDEILDYGCGPGFLANYLMAKNVTITGADINEFFIEQCRRNHASSLCMHITTNVALNKKLFDTQLNGKKFDFVIMLSIAQYFVNVEAVENVIRMLRFYLKENGMIIIADVIDQNTSSFRDAGSLLLHCVKKGKVMVFFRFIFYLLFSNYRKLSSKVKLLRLSEQSIGQIADNNLLSYTKINGLTIHSSRTSYVLTKKVEPNSVIF